jgi:hypothetical protein
MAHVEVALLAVVELGGLLLAVLAFPFGLELCHFEGVLVVAGL